MVRRVSWDAIAPIMTSLQWVLWKAPWSNVVGRSLVVYVAQGQLQAIVSEYFLEWNGTFTEIFFSGPSNGTSVIFSTMARIFSKMLTFLLYIYACVCASVIKLPLLHAMCQSMIWINDDSNFIPFKARESPFPLARLNSWVQPPILTISSNLAIVAKLGDPKCL